jgi:hypothetical protein
VETDLVCEEFGRLVEASLIPAFFHKPADDLLVHIGRIVLLLHGSPSFPWPGIIDPILER